MRSATGALCCGALLSFGCSNADFVSIDAPNEVVWLGAVLLDAEGKVLQGSPLTSVDEPSNAPVSDDGRTLILGYAATVVPVGTDPVLVKTAELRGAGELDPLLEDPIWVREVTDNGLIQTELGVPPLTVSWLPKCPSYFTPEPLMNVRCVTQHCALLDASQAGCRISVPLEHCGLTGFSCDVDPEGNVCIDAGGRCHPTDHPDDALFAVECDDGASTCEIQFYPPSPGLPFQLSRVQVEAPAPPPSIDRLDFRAWRYGVLDSVVVLDDRVIVTGFDTPRPVSSPHAGCGLSATTVSRFGLDLAPLATSTVPGCLQELRGTSDRSALIGVHGIWPNLELWQLDPDGRVMLREPVALPFDSGMELAPTDLAMSPDGRTFAVLYSANDTNRTKSLAISLHDQQTLVRTSSVILDNVERTPTGITFASANEIVVADSEKEAVLYFDAQSGELTAGAFIPHGGSINGLEVFHHPSTRRSLVAIPAEETFVAVVADRDFHRTALPFEVDASPQSFSRWPLDESRVLAGLQARESQDGLLMFFDPAGERFLPGYLVVGHGPIRRMRPHENRDVYMILGWTGELVRLSPGAE